MTTSYKVGAMVEVLGSTRYAGYWNVVKHYDNKAYELTRTVRGQRENLLCDPFYMRPAQSLTLSDRKALKCRDNLALDAFAHNAVDRLSEYIEVPAFTIRWAPLRASWGTVSPHANSIRLNRAYFDGADKSTLAVAIVHQALHLVLPRHSKTFNMLLSEFGQHAPAASNLTTEGCKRR